MSIHPTLHRLILLVTFTSILLRFTPFTTASTSENGTIPPKPTICLRFKHPEKLFWRGYLRSKWDHCRTWEINYGIFSPSVIPSSTPSLSKIPSEIPTAFLSSMPTSLPSSAHSNTPSEIHSWTPSVPPSQKPSTRLSTVPSLAQSNLPSVAPSTSPNFLPSVQPSLVLSFPTFMSSSLPSDSASSTPSRELTEKPTITPTNRPTEYPTQMSTEIPSEQPTEIPSEQPTEISSERPTGVLTLQPTDIQTIARTDVPTIGKDTSIIFLPYFKLDLKLHTARHLTSNNKLENKDRRHLFDDSRLIFVLTSVLEASYKVSFPNIFQTLLLELQPTGIKEEDGSIMYSYIFQTNIIFFTDSTTLLPSEPNLIEFTLDIFDENALLSKLNEGDYLPLASIDSVKVTTLVDTNMAVQQNSNGNLITTNNEGNNESTIFMIAASSVGGLVFLIATFLLYVRRKDLALKLSQQSIHRTPSNMLTPSTLQAEEASDTFSDEDSTSYITNCSLNSGQSELAVVKDMESFPKLNTMDGTRLDTVLEVDDISDTDSRKKYKKRGEIDKSFAQIWGNTASKEESNYSEKANVLSPTNQNKKSSPWKSNDSYHQDAEAFLSSAHEMNVRVHGSNSFAGVQSPSAYSEDSDCKNNLSAFYDVECDELFHDNSSHSTGLRDVTSTIERKQFSTKEPNFSDIFKGV